MYENKTENLHLNEEERHPLKMNDSWNIFTIAALTIACRKNLFEWEIWVVQFYPCMLTAFFFSLSVPCNGSNPVTFSKRQLTQQWNDGGISNALVAVFESWVSELAWFHCQKLCNIRQKTTYPKKLEGEEYSGSQITKGFKYYEFWNLCQNKHSEQ